MAKKKTITPYQHLKKAAREFVAPILYPTKVTFGRYALEDIKRGESFKLHNLLQAVKTAKQLDHETIIEIDDGGLVVRHQPKRPTFWSGPEIFS